MIKRLLSILLVLILIATALVSCKKNGEDATDTGADTEAPVVEEPPPFYSIPMADIEKYVVIYPENASDSLISAAKNVAAALNSKFGLTIPVKPDTVSEVIETMKMTDYEILVGETNREQSQAFMTDLEFKDRGYKVIGTKLVVGAHDSYSVSQAVTDFSSFVRRIDKTSETFFTTDDDNIKRGTYTYGTITVGGADISEYRIVYPYNGSAIEEALATKVMKAIADSCGSILDVVHDKKAAEGKEILIGKTNRANDLTALDGAAAGKGYIAIAGDIITIAGNTAWGNSTAVDAFLARFVDGEDAETLELTFEAGLCDPQRSSSTTSAMTFNLNSANVQTERAQRVIETITEYLPDTVGLQECTEDWKNTLLKALGGYYEYVGTGRDGSGTGEACGILYAKEKIEIVGEATTKWFSNTPDEVSKLSGADANYIYTYATFKRKADNVEFMQINTQLGNAAVRRKCAEIILDLMYANPDKAIIFTGDVGCNSTTREFQVMLSEFMRHGAEIAAEKDMGVFMPNTVTDVFFVYDKYIDVSYYEIANDRVNGDYASDHRAGYIEYTINYNGTTYIDNEPDGSSLVWRPDRAGSQFGTIHRVPR